MNKKQTFYIYFILLGFILRFNATAQNELNTENQITDTLIRTAKIYPVGDSYKAQLQPEIAMLSRQNLQLTFDKLDHATDYFVKIYNCDAGWKISTLNENEYLSDYNEFYVTDFESSFNTKINFFHFRFAIPEVKIAGNYILKVYQDGGDDQAVITRRFCIYQPLTRIAGKSERLTGGSISVRNQEINFEINYNHVNVFDPSRQMKVVIRQNGRWDKVIQNLPPSSIKVAQKILEYHFLNTRNVFRGSNEFRMFDMTSLRKSTLGVQKVIFGNLHNEVLLIPQKSRLGKIRHDIFDDMNGCYYIQNQDNAQNHHTESDYIQVKFVLKSPEISGKVLLMGAFTDWKLSPRYELNYHVLSGTYQTNILLKQGHYNYIYALITDDYHTADEEYFEGSYFNTSNSYEILVYYRPLGARSDILVGYRKFTS